MQVGGIQKGRAMKHGKEKTYKEEADNKEHFMFPTGSQRQKPPSLPEGVPESKQDFIMGRVLLVWAGQTEVFWSICQQS